MTDLNSAVKFVIRRITVEAERSGPPLDESDKDLLENLPAEPRNPTAGYFNLGWGEPPSMPRLRDRQFERLCVLARNAYRQHTSQDPDAIRQWSFAASVLKLNRHPMMWLLRWAGIKTKKASTFADQSMLLATALLFIAVMMAGFIVIPVLAEGHGPAWTRALWIAATALYVAVIGLAYLFTRGLERWQDRRTVEKFRCNLEGRNSEINAGRTSF